MKRSLFKLVALAALLSFALSGCYYFSAKKEMDSAGRALAELKGAGGATSTPYEYCSAEAFLEMANLEASQNDWKHARDFATRSKGMSQEGLANVKKK